MTGNRTKLNAFHGKHMIVMYTKPADCGGRCLYCISSDQVTKSTSQNEDTLFAKSVGWSPVSQIQQRCSDSGIIMGSGNKFSFAIKGNSFTNYDKEYLENFIKSGYDTLNNFCSGTIEEAFRRQKNAPDRCVHITIETRPDQITEEWCQLMAQWGIRTVEIGVPALDNETLARNRRGHTVEDVIRAAKLIRNHGFELGYQVMLGLYGSTKEKDFNLLTEDLWKEEHYPDLLKIYPCVVLPDETAQKPMYDLYRQGLWTPITNEAYELFLKEALPHLPCDVHVNRLQRIFEEKEINLGPNKPINRTKYDNICKTMYTRSVQNTKYPINGVFTNHKIVSSIHGNEITIQAVLEDNTLLGYGRLSLPFGDTARLRDIRVLGDPVKIGDRNVERSGCQHIGIGREILDFAENYARSHNKEKLSLHSSAGSVQYFLDNGFQALNYHELIKYLKEIDQ